MRKKPLACDIEEFGEDQGSPSIPKLICALPEEAREGYRQQRRAYVFEMTGDAFVTWAQWMGR